MRRQNLIQLDEAPFFLCSPGVEPWRRAPAQLFGRSRRELGTPHIHRCVLMGPHLSPGSLCVGTRVSIRDESEAGRLSLAPRPTAEPCGRVRSVHGETSEKNAPHQPVGCLSPPS